MRDVMAWLSLAEAKEPTEGERPGPAAAQEAQDGPMGEPSAAKPLPVPNE
jgi:hypothetical protein